MYKVDPTDEDKTDDTKDDADTERFVHLDFDFLQPDRIRDADGRFASDPDYCPRTLYVPESFLKKQTPGKFYIVMKLWLLMYAVNGSIFWS